MVIMAYHDPMQLAYSVAQKLSVPFVKAERITFADGEQKIIFDIKDIENEKTVVIVQSMIAPSDSAVLAIAFLIYELKNAGVKNIYASIPYCAYTRQEVSMYAQNPGVFAVIIALLQSVGLNGLDVVALHSQSIIPFLSLPFHSISVEHFLITHIKNNFDLHSCCIVAPDKGAQPRAIQIAKSLNIPVILCEKDRYEKDTTRITGIDELCKKEKAIIIDDIVSTGGTACNVAGILHEKGYSEIYGYFVHGVLVQDATEKMENSYFKKIYISNSLPFLQENKKCKVLDISPLIAAAIQEKWYGNNKRS